MYCCPNCFNDWFLKTFIIEQSTRKGTCTFCESENSELLNPGDLEEKFVGVLNTYEPTEDGQLLHELIQQEWKSFNLPTVKIQDLLIEIHGYEYQTNPSFFDAPVSSSIDNSSGLRLESEWDNFIDYIKHQNRFFSSDALDLDRIKLLFEEQKIEYPRGKTLYRARISNSKLPTDKMGAPPKKLASPGRANPMGIPYTYLAHDIDTTLYESRASLLDMVTVGEFKVKNKVKLLSMRDIDSFSPYQGEDNVGDFLSYKVFLNRLEKALSTPVRREDKDLDYIPTQYICEFVKNNGFDGVEFRSSLHQEGINVVIFDGENVECRRTCQIQINSILIEHEMIDNF